MRILPFALVVLAVTANAATESSAPQASPSAVESAPPGATAGAAGVPALEIEWNCGNCKPNDKVPALIQSAYAAAAGASHVGVVDADAVHVTITEFRQRNPAMRSLFGVMAGKDSMAVKLSWHGKQATAREYEANAFHGMNAIAESVGKQTFRAVEKFVAEERGGAPAAAK